MSGFSRITRTFPDANMKEARRVGGSELCCEENEKREGEAAHAIKDNHRKKNKEGKKIVASI